MAMVKSEGLVELVGNAACASILFAVTFFASRPLRCRWIDGTTLSLAASLLQWSLRGLSGVCLADALLPAEWDGLLRQGRYFAAIALLTPPIAVLGARRPTVRAWPAFVLLPLAAVFTWPVLWIWTTSSPAAAWSLEPPLLIGFVLVLVMGLGNFAGTCFGASALLCGVAQLILMLPLCRATAGLTGSLIHETYTGVAACGLLSLAGLLAWKTAASPIRPSLEQVWSDYLNTFGLVWGRRILDRVNLIAVQEKWPVRLDGGGGLVSSSGELMESQSLPVSIRRGLEATFRWHLRRFVTADWIRRRLGESPFSSMKTVA